MWWVVSGGEGVKQTRQNCKNTGKLSTRMQMIDEEAAEEAAEEVLPLRLLLLPLLPPCLLHLFL